MQTGIRQQRQPKDTSGWTMGSKVQYLKVAMVDNEITAQQLYGWMGITEEQAKADPKGFVEAALEELAKHEELIEYRDVHGGPML